MAREPDKNAREITKAKTEATSSKSGANDETGDAKKPRAPQTVEQLKTQHRDLHTTLAKRSEVGADPSAIVKEFAIAWLPHLAVEQEVLVPALNDAGADEAAIAAIAIQKDIINLLLADLLRDEGGRFGAAKLEALASQFDALVAAAEGEETGLFAIASSAEQSIPGLNAQMKARYERTKPRFADIDEAIGEAMVMLAPQRLSVPSNSQQNRREFEMSRYSNVRERDDQGRNGGRERDDQGRFMSEGGRSSRGGRYEDDEDRRYSRGGPERDEHGRFMSEGGSRSRGRYDDEDERYSRRSMGRDRDDEGRFTRSGSSEGRGHGGWFGDSEGHSEASRRGWQNPSHGESGWYGDSEGHSQASRRGWDNPRHGESGWYGDSEGHSEASRKGWEHGHEGNYRSRSSSRYDDDERRYESRRSARYPDDDRDYGRGGHSGWSGDPEGHSEAARRGWQNRR